MIYVFNDYVFPSNFPFILFILEKIIIHFTNFQTGFYQVFLDLKFKSCLNLTDNTPHKKREPSYTVGGNANWVQKAFLTIKSMPIIYLRCKFSLFQSHFRPFFVVRGMEGRAGSIRKEVNEA